MSGLSPFSLVFSELLHSFSVILPRLSESFTFQSFTNLLHCFLRYVLLFLWECHLVHKTLVVAIILVDAVLDFYMHSSQSLYQPNVDVDLPLYICDFIVSCDICLLLTAVDVILYSFSQLLYAHSLFHQVFVNDYFNVKIN